MKNLVLAAVLSWTPLALAVPQVIDESVAALLRPAPASSAPGDSASGQPAVTPIIGPDGTTNFIVRPAAPRRQTIPRKPAFALNDGDRILLLGDSLIDRERTYGYLETRLVSQSPERNLSFRNLAWLPDQPLCRPPATNESAQASEAWLKRLSAHAAEVKPTVVFLGYGTTAAAAGVAGLPAFKTNYLKLVEASKTWNTNGSVRLVFLGPSCYEPRPASATNSSKQAEQLTLYNEAVREIANQSGGEFVNLHDWLRSDIEAARTRLEKRQVPYREFTEDGLLLTAYGYSRMTLATEGGLRWTPGNWRFGLYANDSLRSGGFGNKILEHRRGEESAHVVCLEDRLPSPNPPGVVDLEPDSRPQCYIQIPGLKPGRYALKVDGAEVLTGTEAEWARYEIVARGPQWDQAEALRQAIVKKNELAFRRMQARGKTEGSAAAKAAGTTDPAASAPTEAEIAELEAKIAKLRVPVKHTLEVVRVGSPPAPAPETK